MKFNLLVLTLCLSIGLAQAQDLLLQKDTKDLTWVYQQKSLQLEDPIGDRFLVVGLGEDVSFVKTVLQGKNGPFMAQRKLRIQNILERFPEYKPEEDTLNVVEEDYVTFNENHKPIRLEGHKAPFKSKNVALMMKQVIVDEYLENGIIPQRGEFHKWSEDSRVKSKVNLMKALTFSKLLVALSRGVTYQYLFTGKEEDLIKALIPEERNSVTLDKIFRMSYRLNNGDVYLTLLTIENVLARYWLHPKRDKLTTTTRLKDITNYYYKTDKFGSWYHLFGMMLYGYVYGGLRASIVGNIETLGSQLMSGFEDEKQENYINNRGGRIGGKLRKFINKEEYKNFKSDKKYLEESFYLDLTEDFTKRLK